MAHKFSIIVIQSCSERWRFWPNLPNIFNKFYLSNNYFFQKIIDNDCYKDQHYHQPNPSFYQIRNTVMQRWQKLSGVSIRPTLQTHQDTGHQDIPTLFIYPSSSIFGRTFQLDFSKKITYSKLLQCVSIVILGNVCEACNIISEAFMFYASNAQCTPTDWQSAVGAIANCRLRIGVSR